MGVVLPLEALRAISISSLFSVWCLPLSPGLWLYHSTSFMRPSSVCVPALWFLYKDSCRWIYPTWIIQDEIFILRSLIRSAETFCPNKVTFTDCGAEDVDIFWAATIRSTTERLGDLLKVPQPGSSRVEI